MKLLLNAAQCTSCRDYIVSKHRHDFVRCKCGKLAIDGGLSYIRIIGGRYKSLCIYDEDESHFLKRECLFWGRGYDKNMKLLPQTEWIPIKDLATDHIKAIINGNFAQGEYKSMFEEELK